MPWAKSFCPFRACGAYLRNLNINIYKRVGGYAEKDQAQLAEAELDATFLYEHIPGNEDVLLLKARVEKAQGKMEEAEQTYGKVMEVNPFSIDAYRERSEVRRSLGDSAGAAEDEAAAKEMGVEIPEPSEGIEQKIKEKMQQMDPYKVFHNE